MRCLQFAGNSVAAVTDLEDVPLRPGWARVQVHYNSVCGSDLALYQGNWREYHYPIVPGHEWSGVVTEVSGQGQEWVGRRVTADLIEACGHCVPCRKGLPVMCESLAEIGFTINGGCAQTVDVPVRNLYQLPDRLGMAAACQIEPLSVALHALDRARLRPGERVAVHGCGGIGLMILQAARAAGALVALAVDPVAYRRGVALELGAAAVGDASPAAHELLAGERYDVIFEASGSPESAAAGLDLLAAGGRLVIVGYQIGASYPIETAKLPFSYASLIGVMGPGGKFREAISLLERGAVDTAALLTDFVKLDDHEVALAAAISKQQGTIRVVFELAGDGHD
jgi:threonine dehydrogenase-like Zn-dependent dehydrogenase